MWHTLQYSTETSRNGKVWGGEFTALVLQVEGVMDSEEGLVMVDLLVEVWDITKMKIMGLDPVAKAVMAGVKASVL